MDRGYIKLYRKIEDDELWQIKPFAKIQAWIDLIKMANHEKGLIYFHQRMEECERGQLIRSQLKLAEKWGWSRCKVEAFLKMLQKVDKISYNKVDKRFIKITICNYDIYQDREDKKRQEFIQKIEQEKSKRKARERQEIDINNNVKNKEKTKKLFVEDSIEFQLSKFLFDCILKNKPDYKQPNLQAWARDIDLMLRIDGRAPEKIKAVMGWAQEDSFWHNNALSPAKIRKQFDQLEMKMKFNYKNYGISQKEQTPPADYYQCVDCKNVFDLFEPCYKDLPLQECKCLTCEGQLEIVKGDNPL